MRRILGALLVGADCLHKQAQQYSESTHFVGSQPNRNFGVGINRLAFIFSVCRTVQLTNLPTAPNLVMGYLFLLNGCLSHRHLLGSSWLGALLPPRLHYLGRMGGSSLAAAYHLSIGTLLINHHHCLLKCAGNHLSPLAPTLQLGGGRKLTYSAGGCSWVLGRYAARWGGVAGNTKSFWSRTYWWEGGERKQLHFWQLAGATNRLRFKLTRAWRRYYWWIELDYHQLTGPALIPNTLFIDARFVNWNDDRSQLNRGGLVAYLQLINPYVCLGQISGAFADYRDTAYYVDYLFCGTVWSPTTGVVPRTPLHIDPPHPPIQFSSNLMFVGFVQNVLNVATVTYLFINIDLLKLFVIQFFIYFQWSTIWLHWLGLHLMKQNNYFFNVISINIYPRAALLYQIKKWFVKIYKTRRFTIRLVPYFIMILIRFLEYCVGGRVYFKFYPFILKQLAFFELIRCMVWSRRVRIYRRLVGHQLFLNESLQLIYLALKLKDPYLLSNWLVVVMGKIDFWKHRLLFRYLRYVFKTFFWSIFADVAIRGVRLQLKGKINVAGNARTRIINFRFGFSGISTVCNRVVYDFSRVRTFTGVMGLKVWFFY